MEREEQALVDDLNNGLISPFEFNKAMRELQREARYAYEEDMQDAQDRVRDEWGGW